MNKKEYILFIFEGAKDEPFIFENLKKYFLQKKERGVTQDIVVSYGTVIYSLYKKFFEDDELDEDLDLVTLMKLKDDNGDRIKPNQISEIYLFFDYDGHASNAEDEKLILMLDLFNDEFDKGKLYISYPIVESLLHIKKDVDFCKTIEASERGYKKIARANCDAKLLHFNDYSKEDWNYIINEHCKKANHIVHDDFKFPTTLIEQNEILYNQDTKFIKIDKKVSVLSAFPIMLMDYYGIITLKEKIK